MPSNAPPITVSPASEDDRDTVAELLREWKPQRSRFAVETRWLHSRARFLLATSSSGDALGLLEGHHDYGNWSDLTDWQHLPADAAGSYLVSLYVRPSARRTGVAHELIAVFKAEAVELGSSLVVVVPDEDVEEREARIGLFEDEGFQWLHVESPIPSWIMGWVPRG